MQPGEIEGKPQAGRALYNTASVVNGFVAAPVAMLLLCERKTDIY
jgi:hypothetical protein